MEKNKNIISNRVSLTIYTIIVLASLFAEFMTYDKTQINHSDYFSLAIGFVGFFGIYIQSQYIIDINSFRQFAFIAFAILIASIIKQAITNYNQLPLFVAGIPLLFVAYFRILTFLFYNDYPDTTKKPKIIFPRTRGQAGFDGDDQGYKPIMKERIFSLLLFIGFWFFVLGLIWFLKRIQP